MVQVNCSYLDCSGVQVVYALKIFCIENQNTKAERPVLNHVPLLSCTPLEYLNIVSLAFYHQERY